MEFLTFARPDNTLKPVFRPGAYNNPVGGCKKFLTSYPVNEECCERVQPKKRVGVVNGDHPQSRKALNTFLSQGERVFPEGPPPGWGQNRQDTRPLPGRWKGRVHGSRCILQSDSTQAWIEPSLLTGASVSPFARALISRSYPGGRFPRGQGRGLPESAPYQDGCPLTPQANRGPQRAHPAGHPNP